jgi:peptidoglycan/LPS O-acetylase OafA/YrhL
VATLGVFLAVVPRLLATPHVIGDALSTIFYASNWYSIHGGVSYFETTAQPSPLLHTWSLAIEEQFYLVWPLVVLAVLKLGAGWGAKRRKRRSFRLQTVRVLDGGHVTLLPPGVAGRDPEWTRRRRLHILFGLSSFGALASAMLMVLLAPNGYTTRAYYGTDTRAQALLVGAAIAAGLAVWKEGAHQLWFSRLAGTLGIAGMVGTGFLWATANEGSTFAFSGGFLVASLAAGGIVLGAVVAPRSPAVWLLEIPPLPWLGQISYGIYLWYWPVLLVMSGSRVHWGVYPLFVARVSVTVAIAAISANLVELPIRRGALPPRRSWVAAPLGAAVAIGTVLASTLVSVGATGLQASSTVTTTTPAGATTTTLPPVPTALRPVLSTTSTTPKRPVKVLLVGDSIAGSLGVGLSRYQGNDDVEIVNEGIPGCSMSMAQQIRVLFYTLPPGPPCSPTDPKALFNQWQKWVDEYNPDVVLYEARGETFDQEVGGQWQNLGQPSFDNYVEHRYRQAVDVLGSRGATVVLLTTPFYSSGVSPAGTMWPEDQSNRVVVDNDIIRRVAGSTTTGTGGSAGRGHQVYVFDLNLVVSPYGLFTPSLGPVNLRCADGVHFSQPGGIFVGLQLLPDIAALGQAHAATSPGGTWAGHLPASTPTWYKKLPCQ